MSTEYELEKVSMLSDGSHSVDKNLILVEINGEQRLFGGLKRKKDFVGMFFWSYSFGTTQR